MPFHLLWVQEYNIIQPAIVYSHPLQDKALYIMINVPKPLTFGFFVHILKWDRTRLQDKKKTHINVY